MTMTDKQNNWGVMLCFIAFSYVSDGNSNLNPFEYWHNHVDNKSMNCKRRIAKSEHTVLQKDIQECVIHS